LLLQCGLDRGQWLEIEGLEGKRQANPELGRAISQFRNFRLSRYNDAGCKSDKGVDVGGIGPAVARRVVVWR
jgi:hypothetical protein